jgi:hypothetical protein
MRTSGAALVHDLSVQLPAKMRLHSRVAGRIAIAVAMLVLGLLGLPSLKDYNLAPVGPLLELLVVFLALLNCRSADRRFLLFACLVAAYIIHGLIAALWKGVHVLDFVMAYKTFFYVVILTFFVKKRLFDERFVGRLLSVVVVLMVIKYGAARAFGATDRPGLYTENNFELMLVLSLLIAHTELRQGALSWKLLIPVLVVFVLSGSRSGMAGLAFAIGVVGLQKVSVRSLLYVGVAGLICASAVLVFLSRLGTADVADIDRVQFAVIFWRNVASWSGPDFLTGAAPVTPLDSLSCAQLAYYDRLFSFAGDGRCYSVILHSFVLRVVFDHGAIGLIVLLSWVWLALRRSGSPRWVALGAVGVLVINGLSVSSMYSVYGALSLLMLLSLDRTPCRDGMRVLSLRRHTQLATAQGTA